MMELKIKKESKFAKTPEFKTSGAVGMDLISTEDVTLKPSEKRRIDTGIRFEIPDGYAGLIMSRSGLSLKHGLMAINSPIDSDYRDIIKASMVLVGNKPYEIKKGDRFAQMVIVKVEKPKIVEVNKLSVTERGEGGFGSTGKK